ncbi:uncharacterized protein LOC111373597 [Olea europaea var. sylvestris]|uniref:uncharacterized protein LOC111373597 n=1 Tax=Olea europaea var. sylvestris TaxID=158386 RepID=UPI000C1D0C4F|nr:uncharacterized protein LOC111373597 [Olea europaea var. sylvestris]
MGVDGLDRTVHIKMVAELSIAQKPSVMDIDHEPSWMDPIVDYISNGVLFRRSFTLPYLRCLKHSEPLQVMTEVHEGICGNHQGARVLAYKLIRYGYYWPSLKKDATDYVRNNGELIFLGLSVAVEYFTKWVEAETLATISEPKLKSFIWKSIICRFGIPKVLITDNGRQFDNPQFKNFCANNGIDHRSTSVSHPQSNGLAEVTNQTILRDLRTRIGDAKGDWPDVLPSILWAYRTSHKTATGEMPFVLAFGLEATIPIEVSLPTIRKLKTNRETQTIEHLDLFEEVREQASLRTASYQNRTAKHFNNKFQTRRFRDGDLVLRKAEAAGHQPRKLGPTWEGPNEVIRKLKGRTYSLRDTLGKPLPRSWNANNLKIYYTRLAIAIIFL